MESFKISLLSKNIFKHEFIFDFNQELGEHFHFVILNGFVSALLNLIGLKDLYFIYFFYDINLNFKFSMQNNDISDID